MRVSLQRRNPSGQDLRTGSAPYERVTNAHQRRLIRVYDSWATQTRRELRVLADRGIGPPGQRQLLRARLPALEVELADAGRRAIMSATRLGVPEAVQPTVRSLIARNTNLIQTALMPTIREQLFVAVAEGQTADFRLLKAAFDSLRSRVSAYSGAAWVAIFESQRQAGLQQEQETGVQQRVRWSLHELADHCVASPGFFGCPDLARVYDSWNELETVPAGQVSCRGNCRCFLEVEVDGNWQRGLI